MFRAKILCLPDDPVFPVQAEIYGGNKPCRSKTDDDLQSADQRKAESQGVENPDSDPRTDKKGIIQEEQVGGLVRQRTGLNPAFQQPLAKQEGERQVATDDGKELPDRK